MISRNDDPGCIVGGLIIGIVVLILSICLICLLNHSWRNVCIEKGMAEYNETTGFWQWKENK